MSQLLLWQLKFHDPPSTIGSTGIRKMELKGLENSFQRPNRVRQPERKKNIENKIIALRRNYRLWGKEKLKVLLEREYKLIVSTNTVGRILKKLVLNNTLKPGLFYCDRTHKKRNRIFTKHARYWKYGMKGKKPGELVQIDHVTVTVAAGMTIKQFQAICPVTKILVTQDACQLHSHVSQVRPEVVL